MEKKISFMSKGCAYTFFQDEIIYIESNDHKVKLSLVDRREEYYGRIGCLEEELKPDFFRIHKGYLINMNYVEHFDRTDAYMKNGAVLQISKYKYRQFEQAYKEHRALIS